MNLVSFTVVLGFETVDKMLYFSKIQFYKIRKSWTFSQSNGLGILYYLVENKK